MEVMKIVKAMSASSLGAVIVGAFVSAGNYTGNAAVIAGLFTFVLLAAAALFALNSFK